MKTISKKILRYQENIRNFGRNLIDRISENDIAKAEREYQLLYEKPLNQEEILDIKKKVVIRYSKYLIIFIVLLTLILAVTVI